MIPEFITLKRLGAAMGASAALAYGALGGFEVAKQNFNEFKNKPEQEILVTYEEPGIYSATRTPIQRELDILRETKQRLAKAQSQNLDDLFNTDSNLERAVEDYKADLLGTRDYILPRKRKASQENKKKNVELVIKRLTPFDDYLNVGQEFSESFYGPNNRLVHYALVAVEALSSVRRDANKKPAYSDFLHAESKAGAKGLCQFMDKTASSEGIVKINGVINRSFDPSSIESCIEHFEEPFKRFRAYDAPVDYKIAIISYNAGPEQAKAVLMRGLSSYSQLKNFFGNSRTIPVGSKGRMSTFKAQGNDETIGHIVKIKAWAEILGSASLPPAAKDSKRRKLERKLNSKLTGDQRVEVENDLLALELNFEHSPQWSVVVNQNKKKLELGDKFSDFEPHVKFFNPQVLTRDMNTLLMHQPGFHYNVPELNSDTRYLMSILTTK